LASHPRIIYRWSRSVKREEQATFPKL